MRIKTKLSFEVILLIGLVGMVSVIAIMNTQYVQNAFLGLSSETIPIIDALKDMRLATALITSTTMEVLLIEDEINDGSQNLMFDAQEQIEYELFELENGKALFIEAYTRFSIITNDSKYQEISGLGNNVSEKWNNFISLSNKIVTAKNKGVEGAELFQLKVEFDNSQQDVNQAIHSAMAHIEPQIENEQETVQTLVSNTAFSVLIALNVFIGVSLSLRYFVVKSISKPLSKLRKTTTEIAEGNFVKTKIEGDDEISELGGDINVMSEELQKLNQEIINSERLSSIGSLASRLAHDLRNPLSVIKNSMEIMSIRMSPHMDEKLDHQLAMVGRAVSRMSHQIEDVLDFVKMADLSLESSSLITILERAVLSTDIPKTVKVNLPKNTATVICDPYRLEVLFSNLIKNASQATDGNGEINIRILEQEKDVLIEVEDSGPGIPNDSFSKIFEPLFTTKQTGTGLGLPSCKSIIEKHGGTISARNDPTTFTVCFPKNAIPTEKAKVMAISRLNE